MSDEKTTQVVEEKQEQSTELAYDIKRDRKKSIRQIVTEGQQKKALAQKEASESTEGQTEPPKPPKEAQADISEAKVSEPSGQPEPKKETPKTPDPEELVKKATDEATKRATEEANKKLEEQKAEFQAKIDEILNKDKNLQEKQKESDALIASWEKEGRLPKDYQELIQETMRIADEKMTQRLRQAEEERNAAQEKLAQEKKAQEELAKKTEQEQLESYQKQIVTDLQDLYAAKLLPEPQDINEINNPDTKDEAAKETQKVLQFGVKLNQERTGKGLPPITSLNKIYFLHYKPYIEATGQKPSDQPAGANAPVSGAVNQGVSAQTNNKLGMSYQELHNLSPRQIAARALQRMRGGK